MFVVSRRHLLVRAAVAGTAALTLTSTAVPAGDAAGANPKHELAVDAGLRYLQTRAEQQIPLAERLLEAITAGNMDAARSAYVESRPPYEEIEVLAASFPAADTAIDARPYSIDGGEQSSEFRGFHRIEALLFRDNDAASAIAHARDLLGSLKKLQSELANRAAFTPAEHFKGMIALAGEIAAKKISSEEETWSDQSMLIFKHNVIGINSQYEPFAGLIAEVDDKAAAAVSATYLGVRAVLAEFFMADQTAGTPYSNVLTGPRRAIVAASYRYRDNLVRAAEVLRLA